MTQTTISIPVPEPIYQRLERAAAVAQRSVSDFLASLIETTLLPASDLPAELAAELEAMQYLSDDALWAAVRPSFSPAAQARLHQLNHAASTRALKATAVAEQQKLLAAYDRSMLRRAQALALLHLRGHPITEKTLEAHSLHA
jgi:hypothetical protein